MKELKKALEHFDSRMIHTTPFNNFIKVEGNTVTINIQEGTIPEAGVNGLQITDVVEYCKEVYTALNNNYPCIENSATINHLQMALNWQELRTRDRERRNVEGKNIS